MKYNYELPSDVQEQYDRLIDYINKLNIDNDDKVCLIERVDDLVTWIITSDQENDYGWIRQFNN